MSKIAILGCGQLGSRHLQALKSIEQPLDIFVYDPLQESLDTAKSRYEQFSGKSHPVEFSKTLPRGTEFDLIIVPCSSKVRASVITQFYQHNSAKYMVMEKLLFDKKDQYSEIEKLLEKHNTKAWVNCSMRIMPFYAEVKARLSGEPVVYSVSGSSYGLITNSIHYIDHMAYLNNCTDFLVDTAGLVPLLVDSKRSGYKELNGRLTVRFANGGFGTINCYPTGTMPIQIEISDPKLRCISRESERKAWISSETDNWIWVESEAPIPYQSQMTNWFASDILSKGSCGLVSFRESAKIHMVLLEALEKYIQDKHLAPNGEYSFT